MSTSVPSRWEKLGETTLAHTRIFDLTDQRYRHPVRNIEKNFVAVQAPEWVNVVAVTPAHELVLVNQFRFGIDEFSLEIPGGIVEPGEAPLAAGLRELSEETGFVGKNPIVLGSVHPNPAFQNNRCHLVLVTDARRVDAIAWDADEEIEVRLLPIEKTYELARAGKITHSLVLNALFLFEPYWAQLRKAASS